MAIPAFKKFQNRLKPFCECQNVGVHCKQFALQVSTDEIHKAQIDTKLSRISGIYLSPPQRLPLGIPIKISIIEKIESARGTMGTSPLPIVPRALSFSFSPASSQHKSLPTIQRGLCGGERVYI